MLGLPPSARREPSCGGAVRADEARVEGPRTGDSRGGPVRLRGITRFHPSRRQAPRASRKTGIDPRDRLGFQCCVHASCTPDIPNAASAGRASRTIASGTRGGGRSDGAGLRWSGCRPLAGCSGVVGHRLPPTAAAIRDRESTRHAYALPNCVRSASWSSSLPSLWWVHAER